MGGASSTRSGVYKGLPVPIGVVFLPWYRSLFCTSPSLLYLNSSNTTQIMPFPQRFSETLFRASLYLLVIVIPFTTMAIPVITQDYSRSSTPATATNTVSSKLTNKEIFDIVFALRE